MVRGRVSQQLYSFGSTALTSAGNFAVSAVILHTDSVSQYGRFAIVFSLFPLVLVLARSVGGWTLGILLPSVPESLRPAVAWTLLVRVVILSVILSGAYPLVNIGVRGQWSWWIILTVATPILVIEDYCRFFGFATRNAKLAFSLDATWTLLELAAFAVLVATVKPGATVAIAVWAASGCIAGALGLKRLGLKFGSLPSWRTSTVTQRTSWLILADAGVMTVTDYAVLILAGTIGGSLLAGEYRAGFIMISLLNLVLQSISVIFIPAARRAQNPNRIAELVRHLAWQLAAAAAFLAALVLVLPSTAGRALLGAGWAAFSAARTQWALLILALAWLAIGMTALRMVAALVDGIVVRALGGLAIVVALAVAANPRSVAGLIIIVGSVEVGMGVLALALYRRRIAAGTAEYIARHR